MEKQFGWKQMLLGVVFLLFAGLILAEINHWLKAETIIGQYWPVLLIFVGFLSMNSGNVGSNGFSFGLCILGILLMLHNYGFLTSTGSELILFVLFVIFGIGIIALTFSKPRFEKNKSQPSQDISSITGSKKNIPYQSSKQEPNKFYYPKANLADSQRTSSDRVVDDTHF